MKDDQALAWEGLAFSDQLSSRLRPAWSGVSKLLEKTSKIFAKRAEIEK
jgi:hypothetical protein